MQGLLFNNSTGCKVVKHLLDWNCHIFLIESMSAGPMFAEHATKRFFLLATERLPHSCSCSCRKITSIAQILNYYYLVLMFFSHAPAYFGQQRCLWNCGTHWLTEPNTNLYTYLCHFLSEQSKRHWFSRHEITRVPRARVPRVPRAWVPRTN